MFEDNFLKILFIFRGGGREKEEKHQSVVASCTTPTEDLAHNPGRYPDWESNQQPFGLQAGAQLSLVRAKDKGSGVLD